MNILINKLPTSVSIGGKSYPINTDFRFGIRFELMIQAKNQDFAKWLTLFFPVLPPLPNIEDAINEILMFYRCGNEPKKDEKPKNNKIAYSFDADSEAIFADFWRYYNIDLTNEGLHWWTFRALLFGLPEKSEFKQRIYYRTCDTKGMTKSEKDRVLKIRKIYEIKDENKIEMTLEERNAKMLEYLAKRREDIKKGGGVNG